MKPFSAVSLAAVAMVAALRVGAGEKITFNQHIRPILSDNCFACHGTDEKHLKGDRRLDLGEHALAERNGIRAFVPGDLLESDAWQRIISTEDDERMPPADSHKPPLTDQQKDLIKRWIEQGAVYQNHWAFEPVTQPEVPSPKGGAADHPIDRFIGDTLAARKLSLSPEASRETLLRRVTIDLTGLPPTPADVDAFLADRSPDAYEKMVDRLMASSRYGEHQSRAWLDAVRYADTHGMHLDNERTLWPYRDWVVRALNENKPFDQFTIEQLAGDLLPSPRLDQLVASGYNRSHLTTSEGGTLEEEAEARNTADRIETTTAVWLGLTANCASCHDHKFDPLKQSEYYALGAFFKGLADRVWDGNVRLPGPRALLGDEAQQKRLAYLAKELPPLEKALRARGEQLLPQLPKYTKEPISYEVIWAEDGDVAALRDWGKPPPAGEWRSGPDVPLVGGKRALRLEGATERAVTFAAGEVELKVRTALTAFAYLYPDPAHPPKAISLEFIGEGTPQRWVWGDVAAFGPEVAAKAIVVGPMPAAGAYFRLEMDAIRAGLATDKNYTGIRVAQSGGAAWWDRFGAVASSPSAADDPLLSLEAWVGTIRIGGDETKFLAAPVTLDMKYLISIYTKQQNKEELKRRADFFRDYVYAPLRGALEPEAHAARKLIVEQVHYEMILPGTLISQEMPTPKEAHVLLRGQYDQLGERVEPATPAFLPPLPRENKDRATRLDLARWLVDGKNPLVARVIVNRHWQQFFGAGLVRTPSDFGSQGEPPTHPELLDWLAHQFVTSGWDMKKLVRLIITSRTYRQNSTLTPALLEVDPTNKLLARGPRLRLDAEVLRDQALAISGLLVSKLGGPPVRPYQPPNIWEPVAYPDSNTLSYVQDHGEALYRRSLYTFVKRNAPAPSFTTFDAPSREAFCVGRGRSNTPLQSLALMNDVQQFEAARAFAERLLLMPGTDSDRSLYAFRAVTARFPNPEEKALLAEALSYHRAHFKEQPEAAKKVLSNGESAANPKLPSGEFAAWTLVANLLFNLDETITNH